MAQTRFGIIGSGSWATALAHILTNNGHIIDWWVRRPAIAAGLANERHNPKYLSSVYFEPSSIRVSDDLAAVVNASDVLIVAVPSAFIESTFQHHPPGLLQGKKLISAVKGILPEQDILLNEYLSRTFNFPVADYFTVMGPCHAEEIAAGKLSYLTFSGMKEEETRALAGEFSTTFVNTLVNDDIIGVQYAAVLKNIYAMAAGMAHGLDYGDNFLSVLIANCADEMAGFLQKAGIAHIEVGIHDPAAIADHGKNANYAASVYLGDLLVTCYSLYSRNRSFGNMIGRGYSIVAAQQELNMVAEGFNASRCIFRINRNLGAEMPIAERMYQICWEQLPAREAFRSIESILV